MASTTGQRKGQPRRSSTAPSSSAPGAPPAPAPAPAEGGEDEQLNQIYRLLTDRATGAAAVTDEELEAAVQQLFRQPQSQPELQTDSSSKKKASESSITEEKKPAAVEAPPGPASSSPSTKYATRNTRKNRGGSSINETPKSLSTRSRTTTKLAQPVEEDEEDYDDDDDDGNNDEADSAAVARKETTKNPSPPPEPDPPKRKRGRPRKDSTRPPAWAPKFVSRHDYSSVPFGKQGAFMLTNFGDGPHPLPETVAAALQGARLLLQGALRDARAVRRDHQAQFYRATRTATAAKFKKGTAGSQLVAADSGAATAPPPPQSSSAEMLFRATAASSAKTGNTSKDRSRKRNFDPLSYSPACGFGVQEIEVLFPEQLNAFRKWNEMESSTHDKDAAADRDGNGNEEKDEDEDDGDDESESEKKKKKSSPAADKDDTERGSTKPNDDGDEGLLGGHYTERLAQFDVRTDRMKKEWYLVFSDLRQGSFLPRRVGGGSGQAASDRNWETSKGERKRGRQKDGCWGQMTAVTVRFLHWVGFDPSSALPPPNEDTAQALAFLGHDFLGRIVERAIRLRHPDSDVMELSEEEQLTEGEIEQALEDPALKPAPLCAGNSNSNNDDDGISSTDNNNTASAMMPQLYFGPGFEDRLEMELEEMLGTAVVSEREKKIRQEEEALFAHLATVPPPVDGVASMLKTKAAAAATVETSEDKQGGGKAKAAAAAAVGSPEKKKTGSAKATKRKK